MELLSEFREYEETLADREIRIKECKSCGWESITPRVYCPECHSESWSVRYQKPIGTVYTRTTIEVVGNPEIGDPPLDIGLVEFSGGARLLGQFDESDELEIGNEVQLIDVNNVEGTPIPVFGALK